MSTKLELALANSPLTYAIHRSANLDVPWAILVHGRAGHLRIMSPFLRAIPESWGIVMVQAPKPDPIGGFSWWRIAASETDAPESPDDGVAALVSFIRLLQNARSANSRLIGVGFSQGAAVLSALALQHPALIQRVAMLAGFVLPRPVTTTKTGAKPDILMISGSKDETIPIEQAREGVNFLRGAGYTVTFHEEEVGHKVGTAGMRVLQRWLGEP